MSTTATDALVERLFGATIGALELFSVHLGLRLGLYDVLAAKACTTEELASAAGIDARYAQEWLEQQAIAGFLVVEDGRFSLPPEHVPVFADPESPAYVSPFSMLLTGIGGTLPAVVDAYRTGAGVSYAAYGPDLRDGQAAINRPAFTHEIGEWVAAVCEQPPGRIADVACGAGWSTLGLARAYPDAVVEGYDLDEASVEDARRNAAGAGLGERVRFEVRDAADAPAGVYDLVTVFEALHDMAKPVEALAAMRAMLAPGGCVLVADERVQDEFAPPGDEIERMMYGWSVLHCLPAGRTEEPSAATGTVLRASRMREYAEAAGLTCEVLPIENDFFRFYALRPGEGSKF